MKNIFLLLLLCTSSILVGQVKYDNNIMVGFWNNGEPNYDRIGNKISFSQEGLEIDSFPLNDVIDEYNAVVSDKEGNLLMYTNGCTIRDWTGAIIEGGTEINLPGNTWEETCGGNVPSGAGEQRCVFLPSGYNDSTYYLFHQDDDFINWGTDSFDIAVHHFLMTTIVHRTTGLVVLEKNVKVMDNVRLAADHVNAIKHENGKDWWIYVIEYENQRYYGLRLADGEIVERVSIDAGPVLDGDDGGSSMFSPDGKKYYLYEWWHGLYIYDYDRSTGLMSNEQIMSIPLEWDTSLYNIPFIFSGIAVSPSGRFVYLTTALSLIQVDITDGSTQSIQIWDGVNNPHSSAFSSMILGPDCRIYMCTVGQSKSIHVINKPDEKGLACDFVQHQIELLYPMGSHTFPYFPHFRIDEDEICDPTITSVFGVPVEITKSQWLSPNPASDIVLSEHPLLQYQLIDIAGQVVLSQTSQVLTDQIDVSGLSAGLYIAKLQRADGSWHTEKVVVL